MNCKLFLLIGLAIGLRAGGAGLAFEHQ